MNLKALASHTVDLDLIPEAPNVLDVGARFFDFAGEMLKVRPNARLVTMDPDPDIPNPDMPLVHVRAGLVGWDRHMSSYAKCRSDGSNNMLLEDGASYYDAQIIRVPTIDIEALSMFADVKHWDVVKLDCEGSEFEILENWPGPIATQISVEFHDWDKPEKRDGSYGGRQSVYYINLFRALIDMGYRIVQHERSVQGDGCGHWDSLLVLEGKK